MTAFDLVIFDCDGVLVDSEAIGNAVLSSVLAGYGAAISPSAARSRYAGLSVGDIRRHVEESFGISMPEDWTATYYPQLIAALAGRAEPIDGAVFIIAQLQRAGVPFCVASQGPLEKTEASLRRVGLWNAFAGHTYSAKSVARPKPAPDLFLHAAQACGAEPRRCAVIEDSLTGVMAARAAGMAVFAYCPEGGREEGREGGSDEMRKRGALPFRSMTELPGLLGLA